MFDPDGIQVQNTSLSNIITINKVPEFEAEVYILDDEKDYNKYIKDIEKEVRQSFEYRQFINYLRENMNMNRCAFIKGVSNEETYSIKIEIHHYPFTLRDICEIVYNKRVYYRESVDLEMVTKEVIELHYKLMVGLIPLSETVHQLAHNGRLFIPVDKVFGRYNLFVEYYHNFIDDNMMETLEKIEKYTENNKLDNLSIIDQNRINYNITDNDYKLPKLNTVTDKMIEQIESIKNNNYILPSIDDTKQLKDNKMAKNPLIFFNE